jgi:hypothetical protein
MNRAIAELRERSPFPRLVSLPESAISLDRFSESARPRLHRGAAFASTQVVQIAAQLG